MLAIVFDNCGGPEVLNLKEVKSPLVKPHEVLIKVEATAVNRKDLWRRSGNDKASRMKGYLGFLSSRMKGYLGMECSGSITKVGAMVTRWKEGDEVCAILIDGGGYAEFVAVSAAHILPIPKGLNAVQAAALPCAAAIIWLAFFHMNKLTGGDKLLIHGGAGGVGSLAIQVAKKLGCTVYATAGSQEKLEFCESLGADCGINYKVQDFADRVLGLTNKTGVNYILDNVGVDILDQNFKCLSFGGKLIFIGNESELGADYVVFEQLAAKEIQLMGLDICTFSDSAICNLLTFVEKDLWPMFESQQGVVPIAEMIFEFGRAADAHLAMENNSHRGKILLRPPQRQ